MFAVKPQTFWTLANAVCTENSNPDVMMVKLRIDLVPGPLWTINLRSSTEARHVPAQPRRQIEMAMSGWSAILLFLITCLQRCHPPGGIIGWDGRECCG